MHTNDDTDDWGRDPQVRSMRRIFALMEALHSRLFQKMCISPFDERLGRWRRAALRMFEQEWAELSGRGGHLAEGDVAKTYVDCLSKVLTKDGVSVSDEVQEVVRS